MSVITLFTKKISTDSISQLHHKLEHSYGLELISYGLNSLYQISIPVSKITEQLKYTKYGKPYFSSYPNIYFNISHSKSIVICAFDTHSIGVDIEKFRPFRPTILKKVLTKNEKKWMNKIFQDIQNTQDILNTQNTLNTQNKTHHSLYMEAFYRIWTAKESILKHSGIGLRRSPSEIEIYFSNFPSPKQISCSEQGLYLYQNLLFSEYIICLCTSYPVEQIKIINV